VLPIALPEKLCGGMRWAEGPVHFGDQRCLLFSDLPNNRMLRFDEESGQVSVFRSPSNCRSA
jgi:gluconolactonase